MKVLMFGWEFPPFKSGGLGTACYGLTKGLSRNGVEISFVMPVTPEHAKADFVKIIGANTLFKNVTITEIDSCLTAYTTEEDYDSFDTQRKEIYGKNLFKEVSRFTLAAAQISSQESYDIIHVHDWMTYQAGIIARTLSKKPLIAHIHATEYDRTGNNPNPSIAKIEKQGLDAANLIIANSNFTKKNVIDHYNITPNKIRVVHWGIEEDTPAYHLHFSSPLKKERIVLFLGRITLQKGPDYFLEAARKVLEFEPNTTFVIAGNGDMLPSLMFRTAALGLSQKVLFTGFLMGDDVHKAFQLADLYVMPSVSEPFGLVVLEALKNGTPVIISKQSGVSEVLKHCLKVDFWDLNELVQKIVMVLRNKTLHEELKENGKKEADTFNLDTPAKKIIKIYQEAHYE